MVQCPRNDNRVIWLAEDIKKIVSINITELRTSKGYTQLELANKLNYSDKAVSKWERGESLPDISVLLRIAELFGVSLDYLVHTHKKDEIPSPAEDMFSTDDIRQKSRRSVTGMSVLLVWLVATLYFVASVMFTGLNLHWLSFVYAVPVSLVVWLIFNSIWFNVKTNYFIVSLLVWTLLGSAYATALALGVNIWLIFFVGLPAQVIILLWSNITRAKRH